VLEDSFDFAFASQSPLGLARRCRLSSCPFLDFFSEPLWESFLVLGFGTVHDFISDSLCVGRVCSGVIGLSFAIAQEDESRSEGVDIEELGYVYDHVKV
jgi:hypothetical protein